MLFYIIIFLIIVIVSGGFLYMLDAVSMDAIRRKNVAKRYDRFTRFVKPERLVRLQFAWGGGMMLVICYLLLVLHVTSLAVYIPVALLASTLGFWLPYQYYSLKFHRRLKAVEEMFMDFLIALVDSLKAGHPLEAAIRGITEQYEGAIKEEFQQMLNEQKLHASLSETVIRLANRNPFEDMKLFATAVRLTTNAGGKQVEVLSELIETIRQRREFERNLKTLTADGRIKAKIMSLMPWVMLGILSLTARKLMSCLWTTDQGRLMLAVVVIIILIASYWIHAITDIEV